MSATQPSVDVRAWMQDYKESHRQLLDADAEFERWLDNEYVPIGGAWQY
jgi:hypothetical protein